MLPLGVVIPTRNCASLLSGHLAAMREWLDLVEEVVVVDSESTDGTMEMIRNGLRHRRLSLLNHPPGLYESWNFGISKITAPFVYIATCGDVITRDGLKRLNEVATSLECDVVISKPEFFDVQGKPLPDITWPVDDIVTSLEITQPWRLTSLEAMVFAIAHATAALTGSCASDLFRTERLQRYPFPTGFGLAGDGAWGIRHALDVKWGVVPERFSRFVRHPSSLTTPQSKHRPPTPAWDQLAHEMVAEARRSGAVTEPDLNRLGIDELLAALSDYMTSKGEFDRRRKVQPPWIVSPGAWQTRRRRDRARARLNELKSLALKSIPPKKIL